ncbi:uncharacterized protein LOC115049817 [Echeneis naucrates]|uniref:uncharacterized protein LOC115049817 n=1 Tax=Echeneis naucrates TaxID=173247 RepID=UPI00111452DA|nr:uncharacterized protein LOC115049817 [Echeneis naucrates]
MIVLWLTLLVLHHGYSLLPVVTVQLGEPVTFTCAHSNFESSRRELYWFKQSIGDTLEIIVTAWRAQKPKYSDEFSESRWKLTIDTSFTNLTIVKTTRENEGMYHCAIAGWGEIAWSGTYLLVKGNSPRTTYTIVQQPAVSDPVRPGDSLNLQCSVFSHSGNQTCPADHSVYWVRAGWDQAHSEIIYTDGKRQDDCEESPHAYSVPNSCVYRLSTSVSSSDGGTFYCVLATCGEILFGHGTKVKIAPTTHMQFIAFGTLTVFLAISVVLNIFLICKQRAHKKLKRMETSGASGAQNLNSHLQDHDISGCEDSLNYAALNFSQRKAGGRKKQEFPGDSLYSQIKG